MKNQELANIFYEIADYLTMEDEVFRPLAFKKAAVSLETMKKNIEEIYKKGGIPALKEISGVGKNIAEKIEEYLKTGRIKCCEDLKKKTPIDIQELIAVEGLGPKKIKFLYQKLKIKNLKDLEKASKKHEIAPLFGFGEKTEKNILQGIEFLKTSKGRFLLGEILPLVKEIAEKLKNLNQVKKISIAGSVRRMKETIGDVDFLVASNKPAQIMDFFVSLPEVIKIWSKGKTKSSIRLKNGTDMDLRIVPEKSYGAALQYFTGSKEHNIALRKIAMTKGLKLNEYGLFRGSVKIAGENEKEIYKKLGLQWIPAEIRENQGEIEMAQKNNLPKLIEQNDIKGDLHCHSNWSDGENTIEEIAKQAVSQGYEYIGISDHTKFLKIANGLDEKKLAQQKKEIDKINVKCFTPLDAKLSNGARMSNVKCRILQGCEANILKDGSIDIKNETLKKLDFVIAGVHSSFKMPKEQMTERIIKAMQNPFVDIISHLTGRLLKHREEYEIDFDKILACAKETGTILEINANPYRLDLNAQNIRKTKEMGIKMIISSDSHHKEQLNFIEFGVSQARRGWAEKKDIVNTFSLKKLLDFLK